MMPTSARERIPLLDVLRGFGLLGIFIVNIVGSYAPRATAGTDRLVDQAVHILATDSFYPLFSLLFGIGFALFLDRASRNQRPGGWLFLRRIVALAVIGLVQFVLLEPRDILLRYSVLAVPLLAFRNAGRRLLLASSIAFLVLFALHGMTISTPSTTPMASRVGQLIAYRPQLWQMKTLLQIFAYFLLGLFVWRQGIVQNPAAHRVLFRRAVVWGGVIGLAGKTLVVAGLLHSHVAAESIVKALASPALTLCYAAGCALLLLRSEWRRVLDRTAPFGRMALTNYLLQSVIMSLLFSTAGFALKLSTSACVAIALAATAVQLLLSTWWLRRFHFGPAEWVWRSLTYGRLQPMRIAPPLSTVPAPRTEV